MTIKDFIYAAEKDETVYITDVEKTFNELEEKSSIFLRMELVEKGVSKDFSFNLPSSFEEKSLVEDFFFGKIYNIVSTLGGKKLTVYYDKKNEQISKLVKKLDKVFGIYEDKQKRKYYARSINVADHLNEAL